MQLSPLLALADLGGAPEPDYASYLLLCGGLLTALAFLAYGFRRVCGGALKRRASQRSLEVLDVLPLGGRQRLAVVRCYDRTIVLGVGEKAISLVTEIEREPGEFEPGEMEFPPQTQETFSAELAAVAPPETREEEPAARRASAAELVEQMRREGVLG